MERESQKPRRASSEEIAARRAQVQAGLAENKDIKTIAEEAGIPYTTAIEDATSIRDRQTANKESLEELFNRYAQKKFIPPKK